MHVTSTSQQLSMLIVAPMNQLLGEVNQVLQTRVVDDELPISSGDEVVMVDDAVPPAVAPVTPSSLLSNTVQVKKSSIATATVNQQIIVPAESVAQADTPNRVPSNIQSTSVLSQATTPDYQSASIALQTNSKAAAQVDSNVINGAAQLPVVNSSAVNIAPMAAKARSGQAILPTSRTTEHRVSASHSSSEAPASSALPVSNVSPLSVNNKTGEANNETTTDSTLLNRIPSKVETPAFNSVDSNVELVKLDALSPAMTMAVETSEQKLSTPDVQGSATNNAQVSPSSLAAGHFNPATNNIETAKNIPAAITPNISSSGGFQLDPAPQLVVSGESVAGSAGIKLQRIDATAQSSAALVSQEAPQPSADEMSQPTAAASSLGSLASRQQQQRVAAAMEPVLEMAHQVTQQQFASGSQNETVQGESVERVQNTFNVNVAVEQANTGSEKSLLNDALVEVLRTAARRQGLEV